MNDEVRETAHIKMRPSIVRKVHYKAKEQGKTFGRWLDEAIEEKSREKIKDLRQQGSETSTVGVL